MTRTGEATYGARTYARAIERRWADLQERSVILSPKEWALISDWHARAIPLQIVIEAIDAAAEKRADGRPPRNLSYVAPSVEESWQVVVDGRRSGIDVESPGTRATEMVRRWRERVASESSNSALRALLLRLIAARQAGESVAALDTRLDSELAGSVEPERLNRVRDDVERELEPFADRMSEERLRETAEAATLDRLRRELGLPRHTGIPSDDSP